MDERTMGQRIAEQRKKLGISQEILGEKMGVSRQAISKWEADGAIPEIDKLIAMSRLFAVSVGWLLGVEKDMSSAREDTLTEKQLKMVEELLRRYQQPPQEQPKEKKWFKPLMLAGITAAVIMAAVALNKVEDIPDYSYQFSNLTNSYSYLRGEVTRFSEQLEELSRGNKLLASYEFRANAKEDLSGAVIDFTAVPNSTRVQDQAWLIAYLNGREAARTMCQLEGAVYTAQLELPPADGYSYHFLVIHNGGDSSQQILEDVYPYAQYVQEGLRMDWQVSFGENASEKGLELFVCYTYLMPPTIVDIPEETVWELAELTLERNGDPVRTFDLLSVQRTDGTVAENIPHLECDFWIEMEPIAMKSGDVLQVRLKARLSNGMELEEITDTWICENGAIAREGVIIHEVETD